MKEFSTSFKNKQINTCTCTCVQNAVSLTENTYALNVLGKKSYTETVWAAEGE